MDELGRSECGLSALKHGFFRVGFMLCDRCVLSAGCERFRPGSECVREREAYDWLVKELIGQYGLEGVADQILVWRAALYLIRIARVETYESAVGVTEKSVLWGSYISRLDNSLRRLLNDLAITRLQRKRLERDEGLMVSVEGLLEKLAQKEGDTKVGRVRRMLKPSKVVSIFRLPPITVYEKILADWRREMECLLSRGDSVEEGDSS